MSAEKLHDPHGVLTADLAQGDALALALCEWEQATGTIPGGHRIIAADIDLTTSTGRVTVRLSNRQAERLAELLATDTAALNTGSTH